MSIVFDLDNTLVHSKIDFPRMRRRVTDLALASGINLGDTPLVSLSTSEIIDLVSQHDAAPDVLASMWAAVTEEETWGMETASVEDDASEALSALKSAGLSLALLTNNARSAALAALDRFNLLEYLDLVLARDDVSSMKPSPAGLQLAQRCLGAECRIAMVGDASIDGVAANRAHIPFIAFRPSIDEMERRGVERWATIQTLSEITALLPRLRHR